MCTQKLLHQLMDIRLPLFILRPAAVPWLVRKAIALFVRESIFKCSSLFI